MTISRKQYSVVYVLIFTMLMIWLNELLREQATYGLPTTKIKRLKDVL